MKKAAASIGAVTLPVSPFSYLFSSRTARADPVLTGLATVSAVASLFGQASGSAKTLAAINLKLDQVLANQKSIIQGIEILQNPISQLPEKIAGLYTNENYRKTWEDADKVFDKISDLCREDAPPEVSTPATAAERPTGPP